MNKTNFGVPKRKHGRRLPSKKHPGMSREFISAKVDEYLKSGGRITKITTEDAEMTSHDFYCNADHYLFTFKGYNW